MSKVILFFVFLSVLYSCNWDSVPNANDNLTVSFSTKAGGVSMENGTPVEVLLFNEDSVFVSRESYVLSNNNLDIDFIQGESFIVFFVANASQENIKKPSSSKTPTVRNYMIALDKEGEESAKRDFLLGSTLLQIPADATDNISGKVIMRRKVAKLKLNISDIPMDISDVRVVISGAASSLSIVRDSLGSTSDIERNLGDVASSISEEFLIFPSAANKLALEFYYTRNNVTRVSVLPINTEIVENKVYVFSGKFYSVINSDLSLETESWSDELISSDTLKLSEKDEIYIDARPISGTVSASNIFINSDMENWTSFLPESWKLESDEADSFVSKAANYVMDGNYSMKLQGKTRIYIDIPIEGGACYQLNLNVNCPYSNYEWNCWCTWHRIASSELPAYKSDILKSHDYKSKTQSWQNLFSLIPNKYPDKYNYFRAPLDAKFLRVAFNGYSDKVGEEGVYIDKLELFRIDVP